MTSVPRPTNERELWSCGFTVTNAWQDRLTFEIGICLVILPFSSGVVNFHLLFSGSDGKIVISRVDDRCHLSY